MASLLAIVTVVLAMLWLYRSDTSSTTLGYGEFKQVLQAPGMRFRDVKVGRAEVRGRQTSPVLNPEG